MIICLHGNLGAGKTTFVKRYFPMATSPTFTIINQYADNVFHADLYRIKDKSELLNTDFYEIIADKNNIFFIEWPIDITGDDVINIYIDDKHEITSDRHNWSEVIGDFCRSIKNK